MLTFYYIEQWRYYHPRLFPTLNLLLFPAQTYGINLMGYDHIIRTRPTPSLTMPPFHRRIWWKKRHLWMNWWETHLPEPHHHVAAPSPDVLPAPSKLSTRTPSPPNRKQKAKSAPKAPAKRRRRRDQSRSRSSSPLSLWTFEDKQKLRTLKADEKSRFSWKVIATKMGKSEEDVRSMWNKIKDKLG